MARVTLLARYQVRTATAGGTPGPVQAVTGPVGALPAATASLAGAERGW